MSFLKSFHIRKFITTDSQETKVDAIHVCIKLPCLGQSVQILKGSTNMKVILSGDELSYQSAKCF